jgi:hypothetical protein
MVINSSLQLINSQSKFLIIIYSKWSKKLIHQMLGTTLIINNLRSNTQLKIYSLLRMMKKTLGIINSSKIAQILKMRKIRILIQMVEWMQISTYLTTLLIQATSITIQQTSKLQLKCIMISINSVATMTSLT